MFCFFLIKEYLHLNFKKMSISSFWIDIWNSYNMYGFVLFLFAFLYSIADEYYQIYKITRKIGLQESEA